MAHVNNHHQNNFLCWVQQNNRLPIIFFFLTVFALWLYQYSHFFIKKNQKKRTWFWSPKIISFLKRKILQIFSAFKRDRSLFIYLFIFHFIQRKIIDGVDLSGWAKMFLSNGWEDKWGIWCVIWLLSTIEVYCCPIFPFLDKTERKRK